MIYQCCYETIAAAAPVARRVGDWESLPRDWKWEEGGCDLLLFFLGCSWGGSDILALSVEMEL